MTRERKSTHLQLRLTRKEKAELQRRAKRAGMSLSSWVLSQLLATRSSELGRLLKRLARSESTAFLLAELNDFLAGLSAEAFPAAVADAAVSELPLELANQVAAMVEVAAHQRECPPPSWVATIPPLPRPVFASDLMSLRLHLLTHAPPPFRRRNIFVDATVGDRV